MEKQIKFEKYTNTMRQLDHGQGQKRYPPLLLLLKKNTNIQFDFVTKSGETIYISAIVW